MHRRVRGFWEDLFPIPPIHNTCFDIGIAGCKPNYQPNKEDYFPVVFYQGFEIGEKLIHIGDFKIDIEFIGFG
jgi:hypothetical protein